MRYPVINRNGIEVGCIEKIGTSIVLWSPFIINGKPERMTSIPMDCLQLWIDTMQKIVSD